MSEKVINRLVALGVFLVTLVVYLKTLSTTVVFWDVGEFCAASRMMQVPHPPGSPLFLFLARLASLIPFRDDIGARMHAVSALGSAIGVMFLYLVGVKVIARFRGAIESSFDRLIVYGSSAIGAWALAFSTTYWDNAIEAEVYGMGMLFVSLIIWLILRWWERADEPHNEKYLLLIAYVLGLSTGVHILALLVTLPVLFVFYFRKFEFERRSAIRFSLVALGIFFVIYPGVVQLLPSFLDGEFKGIKSDLFPFIPLLFIIAAAYGAYKAIKTNHKLLHIGCLSFLFIVLGYTTYLQVLMRSNVDNLPMNENNPNNLARLTSYLTREQYGDTPLLKGESWDNDQQAYVEKLFPRRYSLEAMHEPTRTNYSSDTDFLWRYQIDHMFIRYILWNFIGAEGDWQDAGVSWKDTWGVPFLIALFGIYYHFKKDWKMASVVMMTFAIMGIVLDLYQNQQDPQPRERDYFYVGAYYCLALWIGIGIIGIIDLLRTQLKQVSSFRAATSGLLAVCAVAVPVNLARINWHEHDRSQNYIAWDYSYNLLQSCGPNAILFTNGDNDTFPLWYLQDVEGVRRDVRIVNLSLVNTSWYIHQLKTQMPHGTAKVSISFAEEQIDRITPIAWKPRQMDIPVTKEVINRYTVADRPQQTSVSLTDSTTLKEGKISFTMNGVPYRQDVRILRVQDIMVRDIIMANHWERPIHFAVTCSPDSKIGLDNYLWMQGLTYLLKPVKVALPEGGIDYDITAQNLLAKNVVPSKTPQRGYIYRNLNNPNVYYDENVQRMVMNYRFNFMRLAENALRVKGNKEEAKKVMEQMEETVPISVIPMQEWRVMINSNRVDSQDPFMPYRTLLDIYDERADYAAAVDLLNRASVQFPNVQEIKSRIQFYQQKMQSAGAADSNKTAVADSNKVN
ncbi:MAG: DUF2723 domain-containing protein [Ignavibacteriales bacterium]|nr:DUF2723 domain-containing protein [Ignavibacteriales bacterium]